MMIKADGSRTMLWKVICIAVVSALLMTACGGDTTEAPDEAVTTEAPEGAVTTEAPDETVTTEAPEACADFTPVRLALSVTDFGPGQAAFTSIPDALGYWTDECLDVEVLGFGGGSACIQAVAADQADVCLGNTASLIGAIAAGTDVLSYFTHSTQNIFIPHVSVDSDVETVEDFEGKTVGVSSLESGAVPMIQALLAFHEVPAESVDIVAVGTGEGVIPLIESGDIDVLGLFNTAHAQIEQLGVPLRPVRSELAEAVGFSQTLHAPSEAFESQRDMLVGIARGMSKAMLFSEVNPEAGILIHWEQFPESKPTGVPDDEALAQAVLVVEVIQESTAQVGDTWGLATTEQIEAQVQIQLLSGSIEESVEVSEIWTDELLEEINDFDEDQIREEAESFDG